MTTGCDFFRANVGALIVDERGRVLAFQRAAPMTLAWQLPQGGLEVGEQPIEGVLREIHEETGIRAERLRLLREAPSWLAYELPERYRSDKTGRGQAQKWFLFAFVGDDEDIKPDGSEFLSWRWMDPGELLQLAVEFRRPVYQQLFAMFASHMSSVGPQRYP
jgi:putative (di)nucleoside polyphosphate hydrolase